MIRVFIDASVLIAACLSATDASREIILQQIRGNVALVISELVIQEVERNLTDKAPEALPVFHQFLDAVSFEFVRPIKRQVLQAAAYTALKDAPIVAAAKKAQVDYWSVWIADIWLTCLKWPSSQVSRSSCHTSY